MTSSSTPSNSNLPVFQRNLDGLRQAMDLYNASRAPGAKGGRIHIILEDKNIRLTRDKSKAATVKDLVEAGKILGEKADFVKKKSFHAALAVAYSGYVKKHDGFFQKLARSLSSDVEQKVSGTKKALEEAMDSLNEDLIKSYEEINENLLLSTFDLHKQEGDINLSVKTIKHDDRENRDYLSPKEQDFVNNRHLSLNPFQAEDGSFFEHPVTREDVTKEAKALAKMGEEFELKNYNRPSDKELFAMKKALGFGAFPDPDALTIDQLRETHKWENEAIPSRPKRAFNEAYAREAYKNSFLVELEKKHKKLYDVKVQEKYKQLSGTAFNTIIMQKSRYPAMNEAVYILKDLYKQLDNPKLSEDDRGEIQEKIQERNKDIHILSKILIKKEQDNPVLQTKQKFLLKNFSDVGIAKKISSQATRFPEMQKAVDSLTEKYASWGPDLEGEELRKLQDEIQTAQKRIEDLSKELSTKASAPKKDTEKTLDPQIRKEALSKLNTLRPVTGTSIAAQAKLFEASRQAIEEAKEKEALDILGTSINLVTKFKNAGYFKRARGGDQTTAQTEKLMYELATLHKFEDSFVATKNTTLTLEKGESVRGGFQATQEGESLLEYIGRKGTIISQKQLNRATLITLVDSGFDRHNENIIVDPEGNIKSFDNSRSMPNSNGVIFWNGRIIPSFRTSLLELNGSYEPLTLAEKADLKRQAQECKDNMVRVRNYVKEKRPHAGLPPGTFGENSLKAQEERIDAILKALDNPTVTTLEELTMAVIPNYKFICALSALKSAKDRNSENSNYQPKHLLQNRAFCRKSISDGYTDLNTLLTNAYNLGLDPGAIKILCEKLPLQDVLTHLARDLENPRQTAEALQNTRNLVAEFQKKAAIDNKDTSATQAAANILAALQGNLYVRGIPNLGIDPLGSTGHEYLDTRTKKGYTPAIGIPFTKVNSKNELFYCYKRTDDTVVEKPIDYQKHLGKAVIDGVLIENLDLLTSPKDLEATIARTKTVSSPPS